MSEYQYYEFEALDRPLSDRQMAELRALSTRARITRTSFTNEYQWGDFKGEPRLLMERYFDAFLYFANWGTRRFMLRVPRAVVDGETAELYATGDLAKGKARGEHVVMHWSSDDEEGGWEDDFEPRLSTIAGVRAELLRGDRRVLYLGWLLKAQQGEFPDDAPEPPVPAGLGRLSAPLRAFVDFLRIDEALIAVAAKGSGRLQEGDGDKAASAWVRALTESRRIALLERVAKGEGAAVEAEIWRAIADAKRRGARDGESASGRTVGELLDAARAEAEVMARREAERAAKQRELEEKKRAEQRGRYLDTLGKQESAAWEQVAAHLATSRYAEHDRAVALLKDLRDLAIRRGKEDTFAERIAEIRRRNAKRPGLVKRFDEAALGTAPFGGEDPGPLWSAASRASSPRGPGRGR